MDGKKEPQAGTGKLDIAHMIRTRVDGKKERRDRYVKLVLEGMRRELARRSNWDIGETFEFTVRLKFNPGSDCLSYVCDALHAELLPLGVGIADLCIEPTYHDVNLDPVIWFCCLPCALGCCLHTSCIVPLVGRQYSIKGTYVVKYRPANLQPQSDCISAPRLALV